MEEAAQILNVSKEATLEDIVKRYEKMVQANDPANGGSFYIQSKVVRARERLQLELEKRKSVMDGKDPENPTL